MFDNFSKILSPVSNNNIKFRRAVAKLRQQISPNSYLALQERIRRNYPKHALTTLLPARRETWVDLRNLNLLNPSLELEREATWQALQLKGHIYEINNHVRLLGEFTHAINVNDSMLAWKLLDQHFKDHGATLWNLEARLFLLSRSSDESADAEEFVLKLKPDIEGSLLYLICFVFADLYDQATTYGGFSSRLERVILSNDQTYVSSYLKVKFLRATYTSDELSSYLAIESGYSFVDAYEATLKVLAESVFLEGGEAQLKRLVSTIMAMGDIGDIRLHSIFNILIHDSDRSSASKGMNLHLDMYHFPSLENIGRRIAGNNHESTTTQNEIEITIADLLNQFENVQSDLYELHRNLSTTISKYHCLPWYLAMESSLHGLFMLLSEDHSYLKYIALYVPNTPSNVEKSKEQIGMNGSLSLFEYGIFAFPWLRVYGDNANRSKNYLRALWKINHKDANGSIVALDEALLDSSGVLYGIETLKVSALIESGDEESALKLCIKISLTNESASGFLPFERILGEGKEWTDIENFDHVDLAIGLHFASLSGNEKDKFNLEFTCKKLLTASGSCSLKEFADKLDKSDERIAFLLWKIFIPSNLRLVSFLKNVDEADNARLDVCRTLLDLKKDNVEQILEEIRSIIRRKELRQAEKNVEGTRIHVNRTGIKRWAEEKYREQYQRIRKSRLVRIAPTVDELEANLAQIINEKGKGLADDSISKNMEDPLFSMAIDIISNCFSKGDDGLEHFLSLRIRHGSLTGYLRAPLERAELVEQGEFNVQSNLALRWKEKLLFSDPAAFHEVIKYLSEFQKEFDQLLEDLRTKYIQIRSSKKPEGLFAVGLQKLVWDAFHYDWENAETFDAFFDSVWEAFLITLNNGLEAVGLRLNLNVLQSGTEMLIRLRTSLETIDLDPSDRPTLINAVINGTTSFQEAIRVVSQWFIYKDESIEAMNINFDQLVELALNVFKNARPALQVMASIKSEPLHVRFSGAIVPQLIDAFFILLDNVYHHSGLKNKAAVELSAKWLDYDEGRGILELEITNPLAEHINKLEVASKFEKIKSLLSSGGNEELINNEGGSGLIKLARIAKSFDLHQKRPLEFDLTEKGEVKVIVRITLPYRETSLLGD